MRLPVLEIVSVSKRLQLPFKSGTKLTDESPGLHAWRPVARNQEIRHPQLCLMFFSKDTWRVLNDCLLYLKPGPDFHPVGYYLEVFFLRSSGFVCIYIISAPTSNMSFLVHLEAETL